MTLVHNHLMPKPTTNSLTQQSFCISANATWCALVHSYRYQRTASPGAYQCGTSTTPEVHKALPSPTARVMTPEEIREDLALFVILADEAMVGRVPNNPSLNATSAATEHHSCQGLVYPGGGKPLRLGSCTPATPGATSPTTPPQIMSFHHLKQGELMSLISKLELDSDWFQALKQLATCLWWVVVGALLTNWAVYRSSGL